MRGGLPIEQSFNVQLLEKNKWGFFSKTLVAEDFTDAVKAVISNHINHPIIAENATKLIRAYVTSETKTKEFLIKYDMNGNVTWQESFQNNNEMAV
ncbi:MAG: hypothetical protein ACFFCD_14045 [Promethearchaeota archaeon]